MSPIDENNFLSHDLHLLESVELKQRVKHIVEIIEEVNWQDIDPDIVTRLVDFCSFSIILSHSFSFYSFLFLPFSFWGEGRGGELSASFHICSFFHLCKYL